jgi:hypothetical protein
MTRRRGILSLLIALLAITLTACAGLPTSGPVYYGLPTEEDPDSDNLSFFLPEGPQPGASPTEIVEGFIRAGSGPGLLGTWSRAREFLAPGIQSSWRPEVGVTVDVFADREYTEPVEGTVDLDLVATATVDDRGTYERAEVGARTLNFELGLQDDGEWRITKAPDGIVLNVEDFPRVFHEYSVVYFDPTWQFLVPDVRWFPTTNAAGSIVDALVNKPSSDWLTDAVVSSFPESVTAVPSVPVTGGVAQVELSEAALSADRQTLNRMQAQLEESLETAGVNAVEMSVASAPIAAEPVTTRSTRLPAPALVLMEDGFGFLTGDELEPIPGLSDVVTEVRPAAIQVGPERELAAAHLTSGEVSRLGADGAAEIVDTRDGLIDPSIDPFGLVWSVPRDQPAAVTAFGADGAAYDVADAWSGATEITSMAVSRDGTRIAAEVIAGGRSALWVAGIIRDGDSIPVRLGDPVQLAILSGAGVGIAWIDDVTVGALSLTGQDSAVLEQTVGGPATASTAVGGMASIAGASSVSSVRLRGTDGTLYIKRGTSWQPTANGVQVLATQQGMPQ